MRNAWKVAKWEIRRNLKNKSFLIGLFLTPALFLAFALLGNAFGGSDEENTTRVFVRDNLGVFDTLKQIAVQSELNWQMQTTAISEQQVKTELKTKENTAYIFLDKRALNEGVIPVYTSEEINSAFMNQIQVLQGPIKTLQMKQLGLSDEQLAVISKGVVFKEIAATDDERGLGADALERIVPGAFAGIILLSIIFSGMYIFQSASQEKKDKVAEIILSSLTPGELMQGKIIGYFILGMIQSLVMLGFAIPFILWKLDLNIVEYLLVPKVILYLIIAILGYLLFAALFVGIGATMEDMTSAGNFQGLVMMLPFLPVVFIGPVVNDPSGLVAKIGTFIPFSTPGVLLLRLSLLEEWPWVEIIIALAILLVSIWFFMKLAGKIFKTGILMYGKNATPQEIWKWLRA
ncbi:ABC transporter permease [Peptococcaceae bacterium 1198_IL3148]